MITFILEHPLEIEEYLRQQALAYLGFQTTHPLPPEMLEPFERARDEKTTKPA